MPTPSAGRPGGSPRSAGPRSRAASRGTRRPSASAGSRPASRPGNLGRGPAAAPARPVRPRFTGRAAILVLVVAVLTVSYASSMRAYLEQRDHVASLNADIAASEAQIKSL